MEEKIVGITSDGGGHLKSCREALDSKYTNDSVSPPAKPLFNMDCLAYILAGAFKLGVQSIKSDDCEVDTELTRRNMKKCITWTKKIQKGAGSLWDSQIHCRIKENCLLTPVSTSFAYLIQYFSYLLDNKPAIEYLYGNMPGIHDNIRARRPSLVD